MLRLLERLEAQTLERRLLRVADAGLHLALAVRIADPARQRDGPVVLEHVAVQRVDRRVVDIGLEHALAEVVEHDHAHRAAQPTESLLVQLRPDPTRRAEHQQSDRLAAVAEGEHEEARPTVLLGLRMADHRPLAVVDLRLLARSRLDNHPLLGRARASELSDEPLHARVLRGEAVVADEVLPDRHRVAAATDAQLDRARGTPRRHSRTAHAAAGARAASLQGRWTPHWPVLADRQTPRQSRWTPHWPVLAAGGSAQGAPRSRPP